MIKYLRYTNHLRFSLRCHHNKTLDDRRSISRNVASLYILVHDVICLHLQTAISQYHMNGNEKLLETFAYPSSSRALQTGTQSVKPCSNSKSVISRNFHPIFFFFFSSRVCRCCLHTTYSPKIEGTHNDENIAWEHFEPQLDNKNHTR